MAKNYRNHSWLPPSDDNSRRIEAGEQVQLNSNGRQALVIDFMEDEGVRSYWVQFGDGSRSHIKPDQITPLVNP